jgi:hypothetical protein
MYLDINVRQQDQYLCGQRRHLNRLRQLLVSEPLVEIDLGKGAVLALVSEQPLQSGL